MKTFEVVADKHLCAKDFEIRYRGRILNRVVSLKILDLDYKNSEQQDLVEEIKGDML